MKLTIDEFERNNVFRAMTLLTNDISKEKKAQ
jgi:hypothetical protein